MEWTKYPNNLTSSYGTLRLVKIRPTASVPLVPHTTYRIKWHDVILLCRINWKVFLVFSFSLLKHILHFYKFIMAKTHKMLPRLPTTTLLKSWVTRPTKSLQSYSSKISKFLHQPRIHDPIYPPRKKNLLTSCHVPTNHTAQSSRQLFANIWRYLFRGSISSGELICILLVSIGMNYTANICLEKYQLLRQARRDWETNDKQRHRLSGTDAGERQVDMEARRKEKANTQRTIDSEIGEMTKWVWILYRADELEREKKRKEKESRGKDYLLGSASPKKDWVCVMRP